MSWAHTPQNANSLWTQERFERAKALWAEGHSAGQIAKALGGVSRNAVIGKLYRGRVLGRASASIPQRVTAIAVASEARKVAPRKPPQPRAGPPRPPKVQVDQKAVAAPLDVTHARPWIERGLGQCAWPIEVDGETLSCCAKVWHDSPNFQYCSAHLKRFFAPPKPGKRRKTGSDLIRSLGRAINA